LTTVVLLVLAGIWAAVIIAPMVRARVEGTPADSIGSFRRQLSVLERTAPSVVHPANRLREPSVAGTSPPYRPQAAHPAVPLLPSSSAALRRQHLRKRRRDVFFALLAGTGGSLLLGLLPGLRVMLFVFAAFAVLLMAYVGLLIRLRNLAAEREMKLRFLPGSVPGEVAAAARGLAVGDPAAVLMQRSASS
jgi:hypothetical protein